MPQWQNSPLLFGPFSLLKMNPNNRDAVAQRFGAETAPTLANASGLVLNAPYRPLRFYQPALSRFTHLLYEAYREAATYATTAGLKAPPILADEFVQVVHLYLFTRRVIAFNSYWAQGGQHVAFGNAQTPSRLKRLLENVQIPSAIQDLVSLILSPLIIMGEIYYPGPTPQAGPLPPQPVGGQPQVQHWTDHTWSTPAGSVDYAFNFREMAIRIPHRYGNPPDGWPQLGNGFIPTPEDLVDFPDSDLVNWPHPTGRPEPSPFDGFGVQPSLLARFSRYVEIVSANGYWKSGPAQFPDAPSPVEGIFSFSNATGVSFSISASAEAETNPACLVFTVLAVGANPDDHRISEFSANRLSVFRLMASESVSLPLNSIHEMRKHWWAKHRNSGGISLQRGPTGSTSARDGQKAEKKKASNRGPNRKGKGKPSTSKRDTKSEAMASAETKDVV